MRKTTYLLLLLLLPFLANAQTPRKTINGNIISNYTFHNDTLYILDGFVYVKNNAILTIEPGTLIKGIKASRSTLIITRGSKIMAEGTKTRPIVFTSLETPGNRAPGDWGGIVLLGKGLVNRPADCSTCPGSAVAVTLPGIQVAIEGDLDNAAGDGLYGGTDPEDNSGILRYVRIEFAGIIITTGNEINSLTFGGVGRGTVIDHVQATQGNDDSFEWFGGSVNAKYLISQGCIDDDFDTDFGYTGKVQFAISQRDSFNFDSGTGPTTNGFESDNDSGPTYGGPRTEGTFSNVTTVGPCANGPLVDFGSFQNGARLRRNSLLSIFNSVFIGQRTGIFLDGTGSTTAFLNDTLLLKNNYVAGSTLVNITTNQTASLPTVVAKFMSSGNDTAASQTGLLMNPFDYLSPSFKPEVTSPVLSGASFSGAKISDSFFTPVNYRGAIGEEDWTDCWTEFNASAAVYESPINYGPQATFNEEQASSSLEVNFTNGSTQAESYIWDFGDNGTSSAASPTHTYEVAGTYTVILIASNRCGKDTLISEILVNHINSLQAFGSASSITLSPNPADDVAQLTIEITQPGFLTVDILDLTGKLIQTVNKGHVAPGVHSYGINTSVMNAGIYLVRVSDGVSEVVTRLAVSK